MNYLSFRQLTINMLHVEERAVELIYIILLQIINIVFTCVWHNDIYYGLENIYSDLLDAMIIMKVFQIELPKITYAKKFQTFCPSLLYINIDYNSYFLLNIVRKYVLCNNIFIKIHIFKQQ